MLLTALREEVWQANLELVRRGLAIFTFGNASGISREDGLVAIKPSGVPYETMRPEDLVVTTLDGRVVEGDLRPSSDLATHLVLYRAFKDLGGVVHTHSLHATAWAQAKREIPALGTTHADYWHGAIPCTRLMTPEEIQGEYEAKTGDVIVERFAGIDALKCPAVLVASHGPFTWGKTPADAVHNAAVLEFVARLAGETLRLTPEVGPMQSVLMDKHFFRKHGPGAYYGQK